MGPSPARARLFQARPGPSPKYKARPGPSPTKPRPDTSLMRMRLSDVVCFLSHQLIQQGWQKEKEFHRVSLSLYFRIRKLEKYLTVFVHPASIAEVF